MTYDFHDSGGPGAGEPLSPEARARKRELLPVLQSHLARRRARRQAAAGGVVAAAAAALVAAGAIVALQAQPGKVLPADQEQASLPGPGPEQTPPLPGRSAPAQPRAVSFTVVRNDPSLVERRRIDDVRLVQELRSAGYEAGLVRTPDSVFLTSNER